MSDTGKRQSPIKIVTANATYTEFGADYLQFQYSRALKGAFDSLNFVFVAPTKDDNQLDWSIKVGGKPWLIRQIHMHAPAEHFLDSDKPGPFEVHLVHSSPEDETAMGPKVVIGVFIHPGKETRQKHSLEKFTGRLQDSLTSRDSSPTLADAPKDEVDPRDFLPDSGYGHFFSYEGSLTGKPWSEDVSWLVMKEGGVVEEAKFKVLVDGAEHEARELQDLNGRVVKKSFEK